MRVLLLHNRYIHRGGEDSVLEAEEALLRAAGHETRLLARDNRDVQDQGRLGLALRTLWNPQAVDEVRRAAREFRPDVMHVHNFFPQFSPAVFRAAHAEGVATVLTLHNFRYGCPGGMLFRDGRPCEDCVGRLPWPGLRHRCYRDSLAQTFVCAASFALHRALGTFSGQVDRYIANCEHSRRLFVAMGLPAQKLMVKPNFVDLPAPDPQGPRSGGLFVGRLSAEKGVELLAGALRRLPNPQLTVIGAGPQERLLAAAPGVRLLGWQSPAEVAEAMRRAAFLVFPSQSYEHFPRTLAEAFACALPPVASRLGSMAEMIEDGRTGLFFRPDSEAELAERLAWAAAHPAELRDMGRQARLVYESSFTPERNLARLLEIYEVARESLRRRGRPD